MELCYGGTTVLAMPRSFVIIEREEMEYLDGGAWSATMFMNNIKGISSRSSRAFSMLGITTSQIAAVATYTYAIAVTKFGIGIVNACAIIGGIVAGLIAAIAVGLAIDYLGKNKVFY